MMNVLVVGIIILGIIALAEFVTIMNLCSEIEKLKKELIHVFTTPEHAKALKDNKEATEKLQQAIRDVQAIINKNKKY